MGDEIRIPRGGYDYISALLVTARANAGADRNVIHDIDAVRSALVSVDSDSAVMRFDEVLYRKLSILIGRYGQDAVLQSLFQSARLFAPQETAVPVTPATSDEISVRGKRFFHSQQIFDLSPTLQNTPTDDRVAFARYLLTFRDRIGVEVMRASGMLAENQFIFPDAEDFFTIYQLGRALQTAGRITHSLMAYPVYPLHYFLSRREVIEPELRRIHMDVGETSTLNRSFFTLLRGIGQINANTIKHIVRWGLWFLRENDLALRSIYYADEMAFIVLFGLSRIFEQIQGDYVRDLEIAGGVGYEARMRNDWPAMTLSRREVVRILQGLANYFDTEASETLRTEYAEGIKNIKRLIDWNRDWNRDGSAAPVQIDGMEPSGETATAGTPVQPGGSGTTNQGPCTYHAPWMGMMPVMQAGAGIFTAARPMPFLGMPLATPVMPF